MSSFGILSFVRVSTVTVDATQIDFAIGMGILETLTIRPVAVNAA